MSADKQEPGFSGRECPRVWSPLSIGRWWFSPAHFHCAKSWSMEGNGQLVKVLCFLFFCILLFLFINYTRDKQRDTIILLLQVYIKEVTQKGREKRKKEKVGDRPITL